MNIIECRGIVKRFGDYTALNSVSFEIPQAKIFGLLGPNGAGKTTLIRIINQITLPDAGEIIFDGKPIKPSDVEFIGYLPEERGLYKKMKVGDQAWWNKKVEELSKGMAQKVQFITTVVHKPSLLILDEPFSGFDPVNTMLIRNEILSLRDAGATIVLSTHNMESVEELCDDIALINKSRLVVSGQLDEVRRRYGNNNVEVVYTAENQLKPVEGLFSILSDEDQNGMRVAVLKLADGAESNDVLAALISSVKLRSFKELVPRMNDIFIDLVSKDGNKDE